MTVDIEKMSAESMQAVATLELVHVVEQLVHVQEKIARELGYIGNALANMSDKKG
jgi:hypothetical protein